MVKLINQEKLIKLVEGSKTKSSYKLINEQVISILELRLQKLTALGISEIEIELKKLTELITNYKKILNSKKELFKLLAMN